MFDVSFSELMLIGVIALIVIGPERLPKVARTLGHLVGRAQRYVSDVKTDIQREMDLDELTSLKGQMEDAAKSVKASMQDATAELRSPIDDAQKALKEASASVDSLVKAESAAIHEKIASPGTPIPAKTDIPATADAEVVGLSGPVTGAEAPGNPENGISAPSVPEAEDTNLTLPGVPPAPASASIPAPAPEGKPETAVSVPAASVPAASVPAAVPPPTPPDSAPAASASEPGQVADPSDTKATR